MPALIIALIIALSGGTSAVAERAIPGDALYPVKISINEPMAGLFAVSKESKTVWQERLAERRLEEVQKLALRDGVATSTENEIKTRLKDQIDKFTSSASDLATDESKIIKSSELTARLESAIRAHGDVLQRLTDKGIIATSTQERVSTLLTMLKDSEMKVKGDGKKIDINLGGNGGENNATTTKESALGKQKAAENVFDSAKRAYDKSKGGLPLGVKTSVEGMFTDAKNILSEGKSKIESGDYSSARQNFSDVIKLSNDARVSALTSSIRGEIEDDMDLESGDKSKYDEGDDNEQSDISNASSTRTFENEGKGEDNRTKNKSSTSTFRGEENDD